MAYKGFTRKIVVDGLLIPPGTIAPTVIVSILDNEPVVWTGTDWHRDPAEAKVYIRHSDGLQAVMHTPFPPGSTRILKIRCDQIIEFFFDLTNEELTNMCNR